MPLTRIRTVFTGVPGTPWYSNLYFDAGTAEVQACADAVANFWSDCSLAMSPLVSWQVEDTATVLNPATGAPVGVLPVTGDDGVGAGSGDMVSRASQILSSLRTGAFPAGREIVGKCYIPGVVGSTVDVDGGVEPAVQVQFAGYWQELQNLTTTTPLVVWSRKNGAIYPVTSVVVRGEWAVLRSRRD